MKRKIFYTAFCVVVLAVCFVPFMGMAAFGASDAGANEVLASAPSLTDADGGLNTDCLSDAADYIGDRFYLRQEMITAWSGLNAGVTSTSTSDDVILGSNGWLYYGQSLDDYLGRNLMTEREIFSAAENLLLMQEYTESEGAQFLFTIAPNKNSLYPENMPRYRKISADSNAAALTAELAQMGVGYADLFTALGSESETLYYLKDSHWTERGAALGADVLLGALGIETDYYNSGFVSGSGHLGDLYTMLYPSGKTVEASEEYAAGFTFSYDVPVLSADSLTIQTSGNGEGSLLMFRDSFGNSLYAYMAEAVGSAYFSRAVDYRLNLIDERGADMVVIELVERNLDYLIQNMPMMPAPERETPEAAAADVSVSLKATDGDLERHVLYEGTLTASTDTDSPVYILSGGKCYEAVLLSDGAFAAFVPYTSVDGGEVRVMWQSGGQWRYAAAAVDGVESLNYPDPEPITLVTEEHTPYLAGDDGYIRPDGTVTRGDLALILYPMLSALPEELTAQYADLDDDSPYKEAAETLATLGVFPWTGEWFGAELTVTRSQFIYILSQFFDETQESGEAFADVAADHFAVKEIAAARARGWVNGESGNLFRPDDNITRAELAIIINRALGREADADYISAAWPVMSYADISTAHWAYAAIAEAAVGHEYEISGGEESWTAHTAPATTLETGLYLIDGWLYGYDAEQGAFVKDTEMGTFTFDSLGHSTTGNTTLDGYIYNIVASVTTDEMTQLEKLRAVYEYTRDSFTYLRRPGYTFGAVDWWEQDALNMIETGYGNCYCYAAVLYYCARWLGYDAVIYSGSVGSTNSPHGWVEIEFDGTWYIFDAELDMAYRLKGNYWNFFMTDGNITGYSWNYRHA